MRLIGAELLTWTVVYRRQQGGSGGFVDHVALGQRSRSTPTCATATVGSRIQPK